MQAHGTIGTGLNVLLYCSHVPEVKIYEMLYLQLANWAKSNLNEINGVVDSSLKTDKYCLCSRGLVSLIPLGLELHSCPKNNKLLY